MGAYLSHPVTDKETAKGGNGRFVYGVSAMQGWRVSMEDAHVAKLGLDNRQDCAFFGIFDGHGGAQVARFCAKYMPDHLVSTQQFRTGDIGAALGATYLAIDDKLREPNNAEVLNQLKAKSANEGNSSFGAITIVDSSEADCAQGGQYEGPAAGCTAVVAIVSGKQLYVANAGDSRCVLCRNNAAMPLTEDHKPNNPAEERRIQAAGGFVTEGRVNGCLNLSRAIGDMNYKQSKSRPPEEQIVTAEPDIQILDLTSDDRFIILACDGIWDILSNDEAVEFVATRLNDGMDPSQICEAMCDHCLASNTEGIGKGCDNMSVMVVVFR